MFINHSNLIAFILGACLIEFGFGIEQSATSTWMCDYIKSETRTTYNSIFSTIQAISGFIITNILGITVEIYGIDKGWIIAIIAIVITIFILIYFKKKYSHEKVI